MVNPGSISSRRIAADVAATRGRSAVASPRLPEFILFLGLLLFAVPSAAQDGRSHRLTLDDLLAYETAGGAWFSPDGRRVVFGRRTLSVPTGGSLVASSLITERISIVDRGSGRRVEVGNGAAMRHSLVPGQPWSPDSRWLVNFAANDGSFQFAVADAETGRTVMLPGRPASLFSPFAWSNGRLVYPSIGGEDRQRWSNRQGLALIERRWRQSWEAAEPQISISSSNPLFESSSPPPGTLMLADPETGSALAIAEGDYIGLLVSPDGRHLAAVKLGEAVLDSFDFFGRRGTLQIFELRADGAALRHELRELDVDANTNMAWSSNGRELLFAAKAPGRPKNETRLRAVRIDSGNVRVLAAPHLGFVVADNNTFGTVLPFGWIDGMPAAIAADTQSGRQADPPRLDLYVFRPEAAVKLTGFAGAGAARFVAEAGGRSALVVTDGALWRIGPAIHPVRLTDADTRVTGFALASRFPPAPAQEAYYSAGGASLVALRTQDENSPPALSVLEVESRQLRPFPTRGRLLALAADFESAVTRVAEGWEQSLLVEGAEELTLARLNGHLADKAVAPVRSFSYSVDGQPFTGWAVLPPGDGGAGPPPAVVDVYGGLVWGAQPPADAGTSVTLSPIFSAQLMASHGYAVVYPSLPIPAGADGDVMDQMAKHAVAAIDALAAENLIDVERVGLIGQSFGGFSTAAILARRSDRFTAAVALAGIYDFAHAYGLRSFLEAATLDGHEEPIGIRAVEAGQIQLKDPPWVNPQAYLRNSPLFHASRITTPLLMLHGDVDRGIVEYLGAERMYAALRRAGHQPVLIRYWGEGHVAISEWAIRDQWSRILHWFDAYLGDREPADRPPSG